MPAAALSTDGFRLALLAAIAGSLGCASGSGGAPSGADGELTRGLSACTLSGERGYPGSGVLECSLRFVHREQALECRPDLLRAGSPGYPTSRSEAAANSTCFTDQDCRQLSGGMCVLRDRQLLCAYGCRLDSDCADNQLCLCNEGLAGVCVAAECRTDADCPQGSLCTGPGNSQRYVRQHFSCQQASDECAGDSQCDIETYCQYDPQQGHKVCLGQGPVPGRPFLVHGAARTAPVQANDGWGGCSAEEDGCHRALSAAERAQVVEHWQRTAQMEHASVAAFARFTLQLMLLGAPAQLLQAAAAAQADEIRHAEAAFRVASRFHGAPLGPGPLALGDLQLDDTLEQIVVGTVLEGCVGETLAALQAAEALAHSEHPLVRCALQRVAEDEARHAELAWRFVAWAVERGGERLLAAATAAFAQARVASVSPEVPSGVSASSGLEAYGVLGAEARERVRRQAWAAVIEPCVDALAGGPGLISVAHRHGSRVAPGRW
jgi:hypothetical protein